MDMTMNDIALIKTSVIITPAEMLLTEDEHRAFSIATLCAR